MRVLLKTLVAASVLAGSVNLASAAVTVGFDLGNVAVGYSDGYYDSGHNWHRWAHRADLNAYRHAHADMYHGWRHDDPHHH